MAVVLVGVVLVAGIGGKSKAEESASPDLHRKPPRHVTWIIDGGDLAQLRRDNAGLARRYFDNRDTFVIGSPTGAQDQVPKGYRSIPALSYTSLAAFEQDIDRGALDPRIAAVVYDPEAWSKTPPAERLAPLPAMHRFSRLAAKWGYGPIVAPGRDLALQPEANCTKHEGENLDQAYLRCGLTRGAAGAENFVVQTAPEEQELGRLRNLLWLSGEQLRRRAPDVLTLASLSTEPPGAEEQVWPVDLVRATRVVLHQVPGIMLNFTPKTTPLVASYLRDLERQGEFDGLLVSRGGRAAGD